MRAWIPVHNAFLWQKEHLSTNFRLLKKHESTLFLTLIRIGKIIDVGNWGVSEIGVITLGV